MMAKLPHHLIPATICMSCACSEAAVSVNSFFISSSGVNQWDLMAWTRPGRDGDGAGIGLTIDTVRGHKVLTPVTYTVGIGASWYLTATGSTIDSSFASSTTPFASSITSPHLGGSLNLVPDQIFYLAFFLDNSGEDTGVPGPHDQYGWAELQYTTSGGLILLDSAINQSGGGIIAGTTTPVPEPSGCVLPAMAATAWLVRRRR